MKRTSIPHLVFAATFAVLLPLQQLHCACMGLQAPPTPVSANAGHECCKSTSSCGTEQPSHQGQEQHGCSCPQLAAVAVPAVFEASSEAPTVAPLAVLTAIIAPVSVVTETVPALDVGSPPLPDDPGAHGLRAPPVSA